MGILALTLTSVVHASSPPSRLKTSWVMPDGADIARAAIDEGSFSARDTRSGRLPLVTIEAAGGPSGSQREPAAQLDEGRTDVRGRRLPPVSAPPPVGDDRS